MSIVVGGEDLLNNGHQTPESTLLVQVEEGDGHQQVHALQVAITEVRKGQGARSRVTPYVRMYLQDMYVCTVCTCIQIINLCMKKTRPSWSKCWQCFSLFRAGLKNLLLFTQQPVEKPLLHMYVRTYVCTYHKHVTISNRFSTHNKRVHQPHTCVHVRVYFMHMHTCIHTVHTAQCAVHGIHGIHTVVYLCVSDKGSMVAEGMQDV